MATPTSQPDRQDPDQGVPVLQWVPECVPHTSRPLRRPTACSVACVRPSKGLSRFMRPKAASVASSPWRRMTGACVGCSSRMPLGRERGKTMIFLAELPRFRGQLMVTGSQGQMAAVWIVPAFDVLEDRHAGLSLATEYAPVNELAFEGGEEALRHRVVKAVAHRSHGGCDAHLSAAFAEGVRRTPV